MKGLFLPKKHICEINLAMYSSNGRIAHLPLSQSSANTKGEFTFLIKKCSKARVQWFLCGDCGPFHTETFGEIFSMGKLEFDLGWILILGVGFTIWAVLRSLKKYTTILNVAGR